MAEDVQLTVDDVRRGAADNPDNRPYVTILTATESDAPIPIYMGRHEATSIACQLTNTNVPAPRTYQLLADILEAKQLTIGRINITGLEGDHFQAKLVIASETSVDEVDARPSDAINIALATASPIWCERGLLKHPSVTGQTAWMVYADTAQDIAADNHRRVSEVFADPNLGPGRSPKPQQPQ